MGKPITTHATRKIPCPACGTEICMSKTGNSLWVDDSKVIKKDESKKKKAWYQGFVDKALFFIRNVVEGIGWTTIFVLFVYYIYVQLSGNSEIHFKF